MISYIDLSMLLISDWLTIEGHGSRASSCCRKKYSANFTCTANCRSCCRHNGIHLIRSTRNLKKIVSAVSINNRCSGRRVISLSRDTPGVNSGGAHSIFDAAKSLKINENSENNDFKLKILISSKYQKC